MTNTTKDEHTPPMTRDELRRVLGTALEGNYPGNTASTQFLDDCMMFVDAHREYVIGEDPPMPEEFEGDASVLTEELLNHYIMYDEFDWRWYGAQKNLCTEQRERGK